MSIIEKLKKNTTIKETEVLINSKFFNEKDMIQTSIPAINIALAGDLTGGLTPGLTTIAGESKNFKTGISLLLAKAYMDYYPESALIFYDSEFGTPQSYFSTFGIDLSRVLHVPIMNIEELKFDIIQQLDNIERKDKVIIIIDSIGNLASKKEVDDAMNQNSAADMSRAKQLKGFFRIVTPYLCKKDIPMVCIGHTYKTQELYSKNILGGGTGITYSSDTIWFIGRQQDKDGKELSGYNFIINVEKSRYVREKSKIPIIVSFEHGISRYSGLMDIALDSGHCTKPSNGWYAKAGDEKKYRLADTFNSKFWGSILEDPTFNEHIKKRYRIGCNSILSEDEIHEKIENRTEETWED